MDPIAIPKPLLSPAHDVVPDEPVEEEPAGPPGGGHGIPIITAGEVSIHHSELSDRLAEPLLFDQAGGEVESPAVEVRTHRVERQIAEEPLPLGAGEHVLRDGMVLEEPVEDDLVAFLIGVDEVERVGGFGLEPADLRGVPMPWDHGKP